MYRLVLLHRGTVKDVWALRDETGVEKKMEDDKGDEGPKKGRKVEIEDVKED